MDRQKAWDVVRELDEDGIREVYGMLKRRRTEIARGRLASLTAGSRARLNEQSRPARIIGALCTVVSVNPSTVTVDFDKPHGQFFRGVRVPLGMLEPVDVVKDEGEAEVGE